MHHSDDINRQDLHRRTGSLYAVLRKCMDQVVAARFTGLNNQIPPACNKLAAASRLFGAAVEAGQRVTSGQRLRLEDVEAIDYLLGAPKACAADLEKMYAGSAGEGFHPRFPKGHWNDGHGLASAHEAATGETPEPYWAWVARMINEIYPTM